MLSMEDVYREHSHMVYQYLLSLSHDADLAEELTQETFYQAIRKIDYFNAESKVSTWLCGIAKNLFYAYLRKHPYIGSASDNTSLALALGIEETFGGFTSELQTSKQPYGWTIHLTESQTTAEDTLRKKMTTYAYAILALIDNVDFITWEYSDTSVQTKTYTITTAEANAQLGKDIKKTAENICDFQKFSREIGL